MFSAEDLEKYLKKSQGAIIDYAPKFLLAILLAVFGLKIVNWLFGIISKTLDRSSLNENIKPFFLSIINVILKVALFLGIAGIVGIELSIFTAIIAAAFFAIGMSLQGSLGNLASGLIVLSLKPFKMHDYIEVGGKFGKVQEIGMFNTIIVTPGNKTLIIPNSLITSEVVSNLSEKGVVRLEIEVAMPYAESFPKVKSIIDGALKTVDNVLTTPAPEVGITNFDSHNIQVAIRPYTAPDNYWQVSFDTHEAVKKAFNANGVQMAYSEGIELGSIGE